MFKNNKISNLISKHLNYLLYALTILNMPAIFKLFSLAFSRNSELYRPVALLLQNHPTIGYIQLTGNIIIISLIAYSMAKLLMKNRNDSIQPKEFSFLMDEHGQYHLPQKEHSFLFHNIQHKSKIEELTEDKRDR